MEEYIVNGTNEDSDLVSIQHMSETTDDHYIQIACLQNISIDPRNNIKSTILCIFLKGEGTKQFCDTYY